MGIELSIKKHYRDFVLDVSIRSNGKKIGILGASGCGKTLTLKSIAGLIRPDEGIIAVDDRVLFDSEKKIDIKAKRRNVGYLFQNYALFPHMTVEENIKTALHGAAQGGRSEKTGRQKTTEEILETFQLLDIRDHRPQELSGGQQQRTALARMLAGDPEILLLDEPFSALDTYMREGMRLELMRMLEQYDRTVILVSHDRDEIYQMCEYLVLMDEGRVIAHGATDEVFANPRTPRVARLTGCKNITRIEKLDDHRFRATDWQGLELAVDRVIGDDIRYAGIRAHDFEPENSEASGINRISTGRTRISRLPFEWYVTLENGLWWKIPKNLGAGEEYTVPPYIRVEPDRILLMEEEGKENEA